MRSLQSLLAERRAAVQEQRTERDPAIKALCQYTIDSIDRELHERQPIPLIRTVNYAEGWSPSQHCQAVGS